MFLEGCAASEEEKRNGEKPKTESLDVEHEQTVRTLKNLDRTTPRQRGTGREEEGVFCGTKNKHVSKGQVRRTLKRCAHYLSCAILAPRRHTGM